MVLFSIENLSIEEIATLRQSLNVIDIKGSSAQFIAQLQIKLDRELNDAKQVLEQEKSTRAEGIKEIEKSTGSKTKV
jgi:hypothetical protein